MAGRIVPKQHCHRCPELSMLNMSCHPRDPNLEVATASRLLPWNIWVKMFKREKMWRIRVGMGKDWKSFNSAKYQENKPKPSQKKSLVSQSVLLWQEPASTPIWTGKWKLPFGSIQTGFSMEQVTRICQRLKVCRVVELEGYLGLFYVALT